jgi:hypothetical protein
MQPEKPIEERVADVERDLDRKLTFADHFMGQIVKLPRVLGSTTNLDIRLDAERIKERPLGAFVIEVRKVVSGDAAYISGSLPWSYVTPRPGAAFLRIASLPGLDASTDYALTLLVVGG